MIKKLFHNIKNIIRWLPIIWRDRDWDYGFIYEILYQKLKNMELFFRSDKVYAKDALKFAHQIMVAKNLCKRLSEDNYLHNAMFWHDKKYPEPIVFEFEPDEISGYKKLLPDKNLKRSQSFKKCGEHSRYMKKQDLDYLFKYMRKHIQNWWD